MKNLENNKIYKLGRISLFSMLSLTLFVMILRIFEVPFVSKLSFLSPYIIWAFLDNDLASFMANPQIEILARLLVSSIGFFGIYVVSLILSKKRLSFMIVALTCYAIDTALYIAIFAVSNVTTISIIGMVFKLLLFAILLTSIFYGYIGKRIEYDEEDTEIPDLKFIYEDFSYDLVNKKRIIKFERENSFINSYIYIQLILDGKTVCYLKNGDVYETEIDANKHTLMLICHFENIEPITRMIPIGTESNAYIVKINRKFILPKSIEIYKK